MTNEDAQTNTNAFSNNLMPLKRKIVREAVRQDGFAVKLVSNKLQKKKELKLDVETHNRSATNFVGERIGKDVDVMMEAI